MGDTTTKNVNIIINAKDKSSAAFQGAVKNIAAVAAAIAALKIGLDVLVDITQVGAESEKQWLAVAGSLKRHNIEVDSGIAKIRKFADEMQTLTGVSDEVVAKGIQRFVDFGASIDDAKESMKVATDLAVGSGISLESAVDLISKAQVGYTGTLSRYGIIIDEAIPKNEKFAAAIEQINQKFGGAAQDVAGSFAVRMEVLSERIGDLKEDIFRLLQPALEAVLESFIAIVGVAADVLDAFETLSDFLSGAETELTNTAEATSLWTDEINELMKSLGEGLISIEDFKEALKNIGAPDLALNDFMAFTDLTGVVGDNTNQWAIAQERLDPAVKNANDRLEEQKTKAERLGEIIAENIELTKLVTQQLPSISFIDQDDMKEDEKLLEEHMARVVSAAERVNEARTELIQQTNEVRLAMMSDYEYELEILEQEAAERRRLIGESKLVDAELTHQLLLESEELFNQEMADLSARVQEQVSEDWLRKWEIVVGSTTRLLQDFFVATLTNMKSLKDVMKKAFKEIGISIVKSLVGIAIKALVEYIATTVTATTVLTSQVAATLALAAAGVVASTSNAAQAASATIAASAYWDMAAAMAAASLGLSAAASIAGATAVYAAATTLRAAGTGVDSLQGGFSGGGQLGVGGAGGFNDSGSLSAPAPASISVNISGDVIGSEQFVTETLIPAFENSILNGASRILMGAQNNTGGGTIAFA